MEALYSRILNGSRIRNELPRVKHNHQAVRVRSQNFVKHQYHMIDRPFVTGSARLQNVASIWMICTRINVHNTKRNLSEIRIQI